MTGLVSFRHAAEVSKDLISCNLDTLTHTLIASDFFMFPAKGMVAEFRKLCPDIFNATTGSLSLAELYLNFLRLGVDSWDMSPRISIDYAILKRHSNLVTIPLLDGWDHLGNWDPVWEYEQKDIQGVAARPSYTAIKCRKTLLKITDNKQKLAGMGLENIVAVATKDAILLADMDSAQDIKIAVGKLQISETPEATQSSKGYRPWGWFETLKIGACFQVKRIVVHPGAALSLQSHYH